jgi:hypothetical protein
METFSGWVTSSFCSSDGCVEIGVWDKASVSFSNGNCVEIGAWDKASFSVPQGNCVEAGAVTTSSFSNDSDMCVEAGAEGHVVAVRDTKDRSIEPVIFGLGEWKAYITEVKEGLHPLRGGVGDYTIGHLHYDRGEWDAFVKGVNAGEFDLSPELEAELVSA